MKNLKHPFKSDVTPSSGPSSNFVLRPAIQLMVVGLGVVLAGCASAPQNPSSVVETYRHFLMDVETPLPQRVKKHLGLSTESDPTTSPAKSFIRIGPVTGNPIHYAVISSARAQPPFYLATMMTTFDTSVACIKRSDLAAWGLVYPGNPIVVHGAGGRITGLEQTSEYMNLTTPAGTINIFVKAFHKNCLWQIEHALQMAAR